MRHLSHCLCCPVTSQIPPVGSSQVGSDRLHMPGLGHHDHSSNVYTCPGHPTYTLAWKDSTTSVGGWVGGWGDFSDRMYDVAAVSTVVVGHTYQWWPYHMRLCLHFVMLSLSLDTFCNATIFSCCHFRLALWCDFLYVSKCGIPGTFLELCD